MAREYKAWEGGKYVFDFGDEEGPFAYVAGIVVDAAGVDEYQTQSDGRLHGLHKKTDDTDLLYRVHFFVNEAGNGYGVVQEESKAKKEKKTSKLKAQLRQEEVDEKDERPWKHTELCKAAKLAISEGNIELMKALLQAGFQINEVLDFEIKDTALNYSALMNQPKIATLLIANGASLDTKDKWGDRPIDTAFRKKRWDVCEALKKPAKEEKFFGDLPKDLLESLGLFRDPRPEGIRFLSINKKDPDKETMKYFRKNWPNLRNASRAVEVSRDKAKAAGSNSTYFDPKTKEFGLLVELTFTKKDETTYEWSNRQATGSFLSGGGVAGEAVKRYGYWISTETSSWDE